MIRFLKSAQLAISVAMTVLSWAIYPGIMAILAGAFGLIYVAASFCAYRKKRVLIWVPFAFWTAVAILSILGVNRFLQNGFDFIAGNFPHGPGISVLPYLFLTIAITSTLVVIAHFLYGVGYSTSSMRTLIEGPLLAACRSLSNHKTTGCFAFDSGSQRDTMHAGCW